MNYDSGVLRGTFTKDLCTPNSNKTQNMKPLKGNSTLLQSILYECKILLVNSPYFDSGVTQRLHDSHIARKNLEDRIFVCTKTRVVTLCVHA